MEGFGKMIGGFFKRVFGFFLNIYKYIWYVCTLYLGCLLCSCCMSSYNTLAGPPGSGTKMSLPKIPTKIPTKIPIAPPIASVAKIPPLKM